MKKIEVVAAVIYDGGNYLATQRGYGEFRGKWEFPGGKIKDGESHEKALKREILEELDIEIELGDFITTVDYDYPEFHLTMHTYLAFIKSGEIDLKEHLQLKWMSKEQLRSLDWLEADIEIVDKLVK